MFEGVGEGCGGEGVGGVVVVGVGVVGEERMLVYGFLGVRGVY